MNEETKKCQWVIIEKGNICCDQPTEFQSEVSGLCYCKEHAARFHTINLIKLEN